MATQQISGRSRGESRARTIRRHDAAPAGFPRRPPQDGSRSRGDYAYTAMRAALRTGGLCPGQHLREVDIAAWLGLSRTPVREAIRRLVAEGLLVLGPWNGALVAELSVDQVAELYAVRESLEGAAAALASQQATGTEISRLRDIVARETDALDDPPRLVQINDRFHDTLYRAAHNRFLLQSLTTVVDTLGLLKHSTFVLPGSGTAAHRQHTAIVRAVTKRDPNAAEKLARRHVRDSLELRLKLMRGDQ